MRKIFQRKDAKKDVDLSLGKSQTPRDKINNYNRIQMKRVRFIAFAAWILASHFVLAQSWIQTSAPASNWWSIACSVDGSKLVAIKHTFEPDGSAIYLSANSGITWTPVNPGFYSWFSAVMSADGSDVFAIGLNGFLCFSTNGGTDWNLDWARGHIGAGQIRIA
jgi:hypothetical protein